jgi:hypothetical protein
MGDAERMRRGTRQWHAIPFALLLLLVSLALRWDTFGDPNMHGDEVFYFTVGQAMHEGIVPYVDVWDRKPFMLFALYYLIAGISEHPLAYQLAASLSAAATALAIAAIGRRWSTPLGGLLAGMCYLFWLKPLQGFGGQSPVFYNLFIAVAALLVLRDLPALRAGRATPGVAAAMAAGGIAITIKTSALFEAAFLGLFAAVTLLRSRMAMPRALRIAGGWALLGALPTLTVAGGYWIGGHWTEFWHAMVTSNLAKDTGWETARLLMMFLFLSPILLLAAFGLMDQDKDDRRFMLLWLLAAAAALAAVPNFYLHYGLPLLVPLCAAAARFLRHRVAGAVATAAIGGIALAIAPFQPGHARRSQDAIAALATAVQQHIGGGPLMIYDGPPQLYRLTGQPFVTPLLFPTHLSHLLEKDVSHLSTLAEMERVLALRPGAVVMAVPPRNQPVNEETQRLVVGYVRQNCRFITVQATPEWQRTDYIAVWGDCRH